MAEPEFDLSGVATLTPPSPAEVAGWAGHTLVDIEGATVGKVTGAFSDSDDGTPAWLLAKLGRFSGEIAVPVADCAGVAGKVWVPYHQDVLHEAPIVDPKRPLNREQELLICEYFGIPESLGRAAQVQGRPAGAVTAQA